MAYNAPLPEAAVLASSPLIRQLLRGHVLPGQIDLEHDVRHARYSTLLGGRVDRVNVQRRRQTQNTIRADGTVAATTATTVTLSASPESAVRVVGGPWTAYNGR